MQTTKDVQEEWLKILGKGMITIPKKWREAMGISTGDVVKAKKMGERVVIETQKVHAPVPYRIYTKSEIDDFLKEDRVSLRFAKKIKGKITARQ